jgi:hypothetical protein
MYRCSQIAHFFFTVWTQPTTPFRLPIFKHPSSIATCTLHVYISTTSCQYPSAICPWLTTSFSQEYYCFLFVNKTPMKPWSSLFLHLQLQESPEQKRHWCSAPSPTLDIPFLGIADAWKGLRTISASSEVFLLRRKPSS